MITGKEPAFPYDNGYEIGMTIREYLADKAMQGMLSAADHYKISFDIMAKTAVKAADALIKALNEGEEK